MLYENHGDHLEEAPPTRWEGNVLTSSWLSRVQAEPLFLSHSIKEGMKRLRDMKAFDTPFC